MLCPCFFRWLVEFGHGNPPFVTLAGSFRLSDLLVHPPSRMSVFAEPICFLWTQTMAIQIIALSVTIIVQCSPLALLEGWNTSISYASPGRLVFQ